MVITTLILFRRLTGIPQKLIRPTACVLFFNKRSPVVKDSRALSAQSFNYVVIQCAARNLLVKFFHDFVTSNDDLKMDDGRRK